MVSDAERSFLRDGIIADCRTDGRRRHHVRRHMIRTGIFPLSHGSAAIEDEQTKVSVKAELATNPEIIIEEEKRRLTFLEDCLSGYLNANLTIVPDQVYWKLSIDVLHENASLETIAQCIRFALLDTVLPVVNVIETTDSSSPKTMLERIQLIPDETKPLTKPQQLPQFISIYQVDQYHFLDATAEEREIAKVTHFWMDEGGNVVACKGNPSAISMTNEAVSAVKECYRLDASWKLLIQ